MRRKYAQLLDTESDAGTGEIEEPIVKKRPGAKAKAKAIIKRPAGIDRGAESTKKRPKTDAAMKDKKGGECTAIVPVDDRKANHKDRNKWLWC